MAANAFLYAVTVLIWGSTWLAIDFQLGNVAPELSVFYRYAAASTLLFAWCCVSGRRLRYPLRDHLVFALLGVTLFGLNFVLVYTAQQFIPSAVSAVLFSTMLWMNILNSRLFFGTPIGARSLAGSSLGMAGILTLFWPQLAGHPDASYPALGPLLALLGAYVASLGNMLSQGAQKRQLPVVQANAWGMLYGAGLTLGYVLISGTAFRFDTSPAYLWSLAYLAVFGSILGFGAYLTLLGRIGAHRAGYAVIMFPVVAVMLSVLVQGMAVTGTMMAGVVLVLAGNLMTLGGGRGLRPWRTSREPQRAARAETAG